MRRRAFLDQDVITASREFVNVRLNAWLDERNVERFVKLQGVHQNSSLVLLAPDAPGVRADGFPAREEAFWGPLDFNAGDPDAAWDEVTERLKWLPRAMLRLARQYPARPAAATSMPVLPVFRDLEQVLNIAACDSQAVIVEVAEGDDVPLLDKRLLTLIYEPHIVGRAHLVRMTPGQWRAAHASGQLHSDSAPDAKGCFVVAPDPYGQQGTLLARAPGLPTVADLRDVLQRGLARFAETFRKQDRSTHILAGRLQGVEWREYKPSDDDRQVRADEDCAEPPAPGHGPPAGLPGDEP